MTTPHVIPARFHLGHIAATPGVLSALEGDSSLAALLLTRHARGDWGDICPEDAALNNEALEGGGRIMSVYKLFAGATVWIITESDRSVTTLLLPDEY
jgi:hypothetical protein